MASATPVNMRKTFLCGAGAVVLAAGAFAARGLWPLVLTSLALGTLWAWAPLRSRAGARALGIAAWTGLLAFGVLWGLPLPPLAASLTLALMAERFTDFAQRLAAVEEVPTALVHSHALQVALAGLSALGLTAVGGLWRPSLGFWPALGLSGLALLSLASLLRLTSSR